MAGRLRKDGPRQEGRRAEVYDAWAWVVRLIRKWLKAGVAEVGQVTPGQVGTPQGAVISLLANIYLHHVFDLWAQHWRKRHAQGDVIMVRYADDIVVGSEHQAGACPCEGDAKAGAERFWEDMRKRLADFALTPRSSPRACAPPGEDAAHRVRTPCGEEPAARGLGKPETFNFLGFTHISGQSRREVFQLKRQSRSDGVRAKLQVVKEALRRKMHETIDEPGAWLRRVAMGFNAYHAVATNSVALWDFRFNITDL